MKTWRVLGCSVLLAFALARILTPNLTRLLLNPGGTPAGQGHALSFIVLCLVGVFACAEFGVKVASAVVLQLIAFHELGWIQFFDAVVPVLFPQVVWVDTLFYVGLGLLAAVYLWRRIGLGLKPHLFVWVPYVLVLVGWSAVGFPISTFQGMVVQGRLCCPPWTGSVEVLSWVLPSGLMTLVLLKRLMLSREARRMARPDSLNNEPLKQGTVYPAPKREEAGEI